MRKITYLLAWMAILVTVAESQNCSQYNSTAPNQILNSAGTSGHSSGSHTVFSILGGNCAYTGTASACANTCTATVSPVAPGDTYMTETGSLNSLISKHYTGVATNPGTAYSATGATSCASTAAGSVLSCVPGTCSVNITITATYNGVGATVNFPGGNIFQQSLQDPISCPAETTALSSITISPSGPSVPVGGEESFSATGNYNGGTSSNLTVLAAWASSNPAVATISSTGIATVVANGVATITASYTGIKGSATLIGIGGGGGTCGGPGGGDSVCINCCPPGETWDSVLCECKGTSPIVIDTTGHGFHLTSANAGVIFDIVGDGRPNQTCLDCRELG